MLPATLYSQSLPPAPQPANTPSTDDQAWNRLTSVDGNTVVFIKSNHGTTRCENLRVNDQDLSCEVDVLADSSRAIHIQRSEVLGVRERLGDGNSGIVVVAAVAGGYVWGHSWDRPAQHGLDGIIVGTVFGVAAWKLTAVALHFLPGKIIYRRPAKLANTPQGDTSNTVPTPAQSRFATP